MIEIVKKVMRVARNWSEKFRTFDERTKYKAGMTIFLLTIILGLGSFTVSLAKMIHGYTILVSRVEFVTKSADSFNQYANITVTNFIDKQYEKMDKDMSDIKEADMKLLQDYYLSVKFDEVTTEKLKNILLKWEQIKSNKLNDKIENKKKVMTNVK